MGIIFENEEQRQFWTIAVDSTRVPTVTLIFYELQDFDTTIKKVPYSSHRDS